AARRGGTDDGPRRAPGHVATPAHVDGGSPDRSASGHRGFRGDGVPRHHVGSAPLSDSLGSKERPMTTRDDCLALDARDPLAGLRDEFVLVEGEIYLDGNSLGPVSRGTRRRAGEVIDHEWAQGLVRSWNAAKWMDAPLDLGDRLAPFIGARPGEVLVVDTLTFLLAKIIGGSLELRLERHVVI